MDSFNAAFLLPSPRSRHIASKKPSQLLHLSSSWLVPVLRNPIVLTDPALPLSLSFCGAASRHQHESQQIFQLLRQETSGLINLHKIKTFLLKGWHSQIFWLFSLPSRECWVIWREKERSCVRFRGKNRSFIKSFSEYLL